ncbi:MAG: hypothetical protein RI967_303 [Planctomycetota bacterium]
MPLRATAATLAVLTALLLAACGRAVTMHGTADEAWSDTLETLRIQGVLREPLSEGLERPRLDRSAGEIDLIHAESVYYGQGAAFVQVDVDEPALRRDRTVRMWIDYPVGNRVVRYGRALHERETEAFARDFERAHATLLARRAAGAATTATSIEPPDASPTERASDTPAAASTPAPETPREASTDAASDVSADVSADVSTEISTEASPEP